MIRFVTKAVHKCAFCGRETESLDDIGYYVIDVYRKWTNARTQSSTQKHTIEKAMCGECYNKLSLYLTNELTNMEEG